MFSRFKPERRYARRLARAARWDRPITRTGQRLGAWLNMLFVDHGIFRVLYLNAHQLTPDFWRAAQPAPHQIRAMATQGIRTIVNLRGGREFGSWPLEREACEASGIALVELVARSREAPSVEMLEETNCLFETIAYPALIHCKSGADRAGFVSALYLILKEGRSATEALNQLSSRYGHWRWSKTGILDAFIEKYRDEGEAKGLSLLDWARTHYDPAALTQAFKPHVWSNFVVDGLLRRE
ncbi:MAG: tyrosine-protein phosphatase [Proteobacteria bacterium]|nr:tyrosine-protein phosphatase [Pseudomonadota bacterium]